MFQSLEGRLLLALTPDAGGVLTINGTTGNDKFEVIESSPGIYRLRNLANDVMDFSTGNVTALLVDLGDGNDLLRLRRFDGTSAVRIPATVLGGLGNDTITGGDGDDRLSGQDGDDRLDGRAGADRIFGNAGYDTADYGTRTDNLVVTLDLLANDGASGEGDDVRTEAVLGGSGNDQIFGDTAANVLDGGAGNDKLAGGPGDDSLTGGAGADSVWGEDGNDFLTARDTILDKISDGSGTDFARVDALLAGDPVDDVPLGTLPPIPSSLSALSLMSSFAFAGFGPATSSAFIGSGIDGLDETFGSGGKLVTMLDGSLAQINDVALQRVEVSPGNSEAKIVVVGTALGSVGDYDFLVIRYNADGTLDVTFGGGDGIVTTDFASGSGFNTDVASSLVVDAAGRLVVAGASLKRADLDNSTLQGFADFAVARYLPDGTLDTSFDGDGLVTADLGGPQSDDRASAIAIQRLNVGGVIVEKYVVVGTLGLAFKNANPNFPTADIGMMRLNADGSHDSQFGSVRTQFTPGVSHDYATGVAIDPANANIWVSGYTGSAGGSFDLALVGYGSGGALMISTSIDLGASEQAADIVLNGTQALLVGTSSDPWSSSGLIASFNITSADPFFAPGDLFASTIVGDGASAIQFQSIVIDNEGRGVAVGTIGDGVNPSDFFVYRFDAQTLASDDVYAITDFGGGTADGAYAAVVQPDGKVVVAGLSGDDAALARYDLERPLAEFLLTAEEEQAWQFTYDENGQILTLPVYLIDRLRSPLAPNGVLTINGSDDDDVITLSQSGGLITVDKNGESVSYDESLITRIVFNGYDGDDLFVADAGVSVPLSIDGGAGDDTLLAGAADDNILGRDGHDVLVGGDGADLLDGGAGNDILIGGNGADSLVGNEGDDILIGGYTKHDRDLVALTAIQAEWTSPTSYTNRVANLGGAGAGTGLNGTYHLRPGSPTVKTIFDDGAVDQLSGGGGLDWFILRTKLPADLLLDRTKGESLAQV